MPNITISESDKSQLDQIFINSSFEGKVLVSENPTPPGPTPGEHFFSGNLEFQTLDDVVCAPLPESLQFETSQRYDVTIGSLGKKTLKYNAEMEMFADPSRYYLIGELSPGEMIIAIFGAEPGTYSVVIDVAEPLPEPVYPCIWLQDLYFEFDEDEQSSSASDNNMLDMQNLSSNKIYRVKLTNDSRIVQFDTNMIYSNFGPGDESTKLVSDIFNIADIKDYMLVRNREYYDESLFEIFYVYEVTSEIDGVFRTTIDELGDIPLNEQVFISIYIGDGAANPRCDGCIFKSLLDSVSIDGSAQVQITVNTVGGGTDTWYETLSTKKDEQDNVVCYRIQSNEHLHSATSLELSSLIIQQGSNSITFSDLPSVSRGEFGNDYGYTYAYNWTLS